MPGKPTHEDLEKRLQKLEQALSAYERIADMHKQAVYKKIAKNGRIVSSALKLYEVYVKFVAAVKKNIPFDGLDIGFIDEEADTVPEENQAQYKSIFQQNPSIILVRDSESGDIVDVNPVAAAFYGYPREKMIGMNLAEISLSPPDLIRERVQQSLIYGKNHFESRHRLANGEERDVEIYSNKMMAGSQKIVLDILHDITERKQAEEALAQRMAFERVISKISSKFAGIRLDSINDGIESALASIGTFSGADRAYVFLFRNGGNLADNTHEWCGEGVTPQKKNLKNIPVAEELPWFLEKIQRHEIFHVPDIKALPPEARREQKYFEAQGIKSLVVVPMRLHGRLIGFLGFDAVSGYRAWTEDDQNLLRLTGETFANLIGREQMEKALRESEEKYKHLYEDAPVGYLEYDREGRIINVNKKELEMLGYTREEMVGHFLWDFTLDKESAIKSITAKLSGKMPGSNGLERTYIRKDGTTFPAIIDNFIVKNENGRIELVRSVHRDITKIKQAEKERDDLIAELKKTLSEVKTLRGFLPICAHCKKIRDDKGYWNEIEAYIHEHSDTEFSHGICPACVKKYYPGIKLPEDLG